MPRASTPSPLEGDDDSLLVPNQKQPVGEVRPYHHDFESGAPPVHDRAAEDFRETDWPFTIEDAFSRVDRELQLIPKHAFSPSAFSQLQDAIRGYIADLIDTSSRLARRQGVDSISAAHVIHAARTITPQPQRRIDRMIGLLGGMLLGGFLPEFVNSVVKEQSLAPAWIVVGNVGVAMLIYEQFKN